MDVLSVFGNGRRALLLLHKYNAVLRNSSDLETEDVLLELLDLL